MPYIGEIRMFAGNFPPAGWALCDGQTLPISENDALFTLIGTTYGGDGESTFRLPDLRGRIPMHAGVSPFGTARYLGEPVGVESAGLSGGLGQTGGGSVTVYANRHPMSTAYSPVAVASPATGTQPGSLMPPFTTITFIISLYGEYPHT